MTMETEMEMEMETDTTSQVVERVADPAPPTPFDPRPAIPLDPRPAIPFDPRATGDAAFIKVYSMVENSSLDDRAAEYLQLYIQRDWLKSQHGLALDLEGDIVAQLSSLSITKIPSHADDENNGLPNRKLSSGVDLTTETVIGHLDWIKHRTRILTHPRRGSKFREKVWVYLYASNAMYGETSGKNTLDLITSLLQFVRQDLSRAPMSEEDEEALRIQRLQRFISASTNPPPKQPRPARKKQKTQGKGSIAQQSEQADPHRRSQADMKRNKRGNAVEGQEERDERKKHRLQLKRQKVVKGVVEQRDEDMEGMAGFQDGGDGQPERKLRRSLRLQQAKKLRSLESENKEEEGPRDAHGLRGDEDMEGMDDDQPLGNLQAVDTTEGMENSKMEVME